jgi:hypothetical protein
MPAGLKVYGEVAVTLSMVYVSLIGNAVVAAVVLAATPSMYFSIVTVIGPGGVTSPEVVLNCRTAPGYHTPPTRDHAAK